MNLTKIVCISTILLLITSMASCQSQTGTIKIGYIGPLSGPSAVLGIDALSAIKIAVDDANANGGVNGRKIDLIVEDDQYIPQKTVTAYNKIVNTDGAEILLISTYGGVFAVTEQAKKDGVLVIDPLDCNDEIAALPNNVFCVATETESIGTSLASYLIAHDKMNAAVMYSTKDEFMSLVTRAFKTTYEAAGGKTQEVSFDYTETDFKTQLMKIKESNPDAILFLGHDETGLAMKQARELGIESQFLATGTITSPPLQTAANGATEGAVFAYWESSKNAASDEFEKKFVAIVGRPPILSLTSHPAYDAMNLVINKALPSGSGIDDKARRAESYRQALLFVNGEAGTTGVLSMAKDRTIRIKESAFRLEGGNPARIQ